MTEAKRKSVEVLEEAIALQIKKGNDYQNSASRVRQADYYPHGINSILDTINAKVLRMFSVIETMEAGGSVNFESIEDSAIDGINYLSFLVSYMRGEIDGQQPDRDIFNKTGQQNRALIPTKFRTQPVGNIIGVNK
jgi:hypothetical protein